MRGLRYRQGTSRYTGAEAGLEVAVLPNLWLISRLDYVNAELTTQNTPLLRIPPLRGVVGLHGTCKGFRISPEVVMSNRQSRIFTTETETAGCAVLDVVASYTIAQHHAAHVFSVNTFDLGDRRYRNNLSFIKEFAPEIGRGVRFTYMLRFF
jgi:iron complex outermembrane recepter protein